MRWPFSCIYVKRKIKKYDLKLDESDGLNGTYGPNIIWVQRRFLRRNLCSVLRLWKNDVSGDII